MCKTDPKSRITIRLTNNQHLVLKELQEALDIPISFLVRTIILDFLTRNEDALEKIITGELIIDKNQIFGNDKD